MNKWIYSHETYASREITRDSVVAPFFLQLSVVIVTHSLYQGLSLGRSLAPPLPEAARVPAADWRSTGAREPFFNRGSMLKISQMIRWFPLPPYAISHLSSKF